MQKLTLLVACLTFADHSRQVQTSTDQLVDDVFRLRQKEPIGNSTKALARFLSVLNPANAGLSFSWLKNSRSLASSGSPIQSSRNVPVLGGTEMLRPPSDVVGKAKAEERRKEGRVKKPGNETKEYKGGRPGKGTAAEVFATRTRRWLLTLLAMRAVIERAMRRKRTLPVVLVHGIRSATEGMEVAAQWVRNALGGGVYVRAIEIGNGPGDSLHRTMEWQLNRLAEQIQADNKLVDGFNLIGYSQGSLLARAFVQRYDFPRVHVLVSWAGPQAGQFGVPQYEPLLKKMSHITSSMWYTSALQSSFSFSNYWRDPTRLQLYQQQSSFLADINNEREVRNASYAARMARLEHFVLVKSSKDEVIHPQMSSWFGFYRDNSTTEVVPLRQTKLYTEDRIGLRSLDRAGRLHFAECACSHVDVPTDKCKVDVFDRATRHFLKPERGIVSLLRWLRLHMRPPRIPFPLSEDERAAMNAARALTILEEEREKVRLLEEELQRERERAKAALRELRQLQK